MEALGARLEIGAEQSAGKAVAEQRGEPANTINSYLLKASGNTDTPQLKSLAQ
jgi:hypothetical protein